MVAGWDKKGGRGEEEETVVLVCVGELERKQGLELGGVFFGKERERRFLSVDRKKVYGAGCCCWGSNKKKGKEG